MSKLAILVVAALCACGEVHSQSNPDGASSDGPPQVACTTSAMCSGAAPACDTAKMVCVACTPTEIGACADTTPVCADDETCRACMAHSECASDVCLPDGSCGAEAQVAFVDPAAAGSATCTRLMPCSTIAAALATTRGIIKIRGTLDEAVTLASRNVVFLAEDGATLKNGQGDGITISGSSHVEIYDLTIAQATSGIHVPPGTTVSLFLLRAKVQNNRNGGVFVESGTVTIAGSTIATNTGAGGLLNQGAQASVTTTTFSDNSGGAGIIMTSGSLAVSRSTFINNRNGGVYVMPRGRFQIVGNAFFNNGLSTSNTGGVMIDEANELATGCRLELNTFVQNKTTSTVGPAIQCNVLGSFTARSNIMSDNSGGATQFAGNCTHAYSISRPGSVPTGTGNLAADPAFVNAATGNLHLTAASPARGVGDPATDLTGIAALDLDGDMRATPPDIGADQFKP